MPTYRFQIEDGSDAPQPDPLELSSFEEAKSVAAVAAGEALRDLGGDFWKSGKWRLEVTDSAGLVLLSIHVTGIAQRR